MSDGTKFATKEQDEWYEKHAEKDRLHSHAVNVQAETSIAEIREYVATLQVIFSNQEDKLRNMANKLEEHMGMPDAHNPGILRKK